MNNLIFKRIENGLLNNTNQICFARKVRGKWQYTSNVQYFNYARNIAYGLIQIGITSNDMVVILSENRPEWNYVDLALLKSGIISVPLYATISDDQLVEILNETESKIIFVSNKYLYRKVKDNQHRLSSLKFIYSFNEIEGVSNIYELIELGKSNPQPEKLNEIEANIKLTDVYSILYTSGTTGSAKGVMLTHESHSIVIKDMSERTNIQDGDRTILYLPLNNSFGRTITYIAQIKGMTTYYIDGIETILQMFQEVKPTFLSTIPILLERIINNVIARGETFEGEQRQFFEMAKNIFSKFININELTPEEQNLFPIIDKKLFEEWRNILGGKMKVLLAGGAQVSKEIIHFYRALGITILNGYGLTETSGVIAADTHNELPKPNRCGRKITGMEIKLDIDGEILARGKNLMVGYFKHPEITEETIDKEGWIHTGDIGIIDDDGYIGVIGRKKSAFKNAAGTFVYPEPIEDELKKSDFISQIVVTGLNKPYLIAIILVNKEYIANWAYKNNINYNAIEELETNAQFINEIIKVIEPYNKNKINKANKILKFKILFDNWSVKTGELTPTMKVKRNFLLKKYFSTIENLY